MRVNKLKLSALSALLVSVTLAGCAEFSPSDPQDNGEPGISQEPTFVFYPDGSASQNIEAFEGVLRASGAGTDVFDLDLAVRYLVETGFLIESITHTPTLTNIGEPADSVSLAISFKGECLIGQFSSSWLTTTIAQPTASGCLIGDFEQARLD
jgi:hypothetical protein